MEDGHCKEEVKGLSQCWHLEEAPLEMDACMDGVCILRAHLELMEVIMMAMGILEGGSMKRQRM